MDKVKFLEFDVVSGDALFVPPYWWYSIQYIEPDTIVSSITYRNVMNCLANSPEYILYFFQQQNTRTRIAKVLAVPEEKVDKKEGEGENGSGTGSGSADGQELTPIEQSIQLLSVKNKVTE
jgi:hypothetical protein